MSTHLEEFFRIHRKEMEKLTKQSPVELAGPCLLDLPKRVLEAFWENPSVLLSIAQKSGYLGFCTGLTQFMNKGSDRFLQYMEKFPTQAFHGSNLKTSLKMGVSYQDLVKQEAQLLEHAKEDVFINYDLFSGMLAPVSSNHLQTLNSYMEIASCALQSPPSIEGYLEAIISIIHNAFPKKRVFLEIPGAYGGSGFPPFKPEILAFIVSLLRDNMMLCIDLGHLLTWCLNGDNKPDRELFAYNIEMLRPVVSKVGLLHLSSAGGYRKEFLRLWEAAYKESPAWNIPHFGSTFNFSKRKRAWR